MTPFSRLASVTIALTGLLVPGELHAQVFLPQDGNITVKQYLAEAGGVAKYVAPGRLELAGKRMMCGNRPSVLDPEFDTWAGAYTDPGFIIVNPIYMEKEEAVVQWYIYAHECGHQFMGFDEDTADEFAIRRGVRQGWLKDRGMEQVCRFISKVPGDDEHPAGTLRCKSMRLVYADAVRLNKEHIADKKRSRFDEPPVAIGRRR